MDSCIAGRTLRFTTIRRQCCAEVVLGANRVSSFVLV